MKAKHTLFLFSLPLIFLLTACPSEDKPSADDLIASDLLTDKEKKEKKAVEIPPEMVANIINSIPSPVETSQLIKEAGVDYNSNFMNPTSNSSNYNTSFAQALNLGIYGTDLGFTNIYDKKQDAISYMNVVRSLADELKIGKHFDFTLIRRLVENSSNLDSLLLITTQNFQNINKDLQESGRQELSLMIILGGWLEGLHLMGEVINANPKRDLSQLKERVGEQKVVLDQIMIILENYKTNNKVKAVYQGMLAIQNKYEDITIEEKYEGGEMKEIDGVMTYVQKKTTTVYISDQQLSAILEMARNLRSTILAAKV